MPLEIDDLAGPDGGEEGQRLAKFWQAQIEKVRDDSRYKRWCKRGHTIEKRYRDERSRVDEEGQRRYNSLWANVQILTPAIYGRCPTAVAERRFKDKDPTGRGAAQILERALRNEMEICGFDEAISQAVGDYLLPGRGVVWVRYEPEFSPSISISPEGTIDQTDNQGEIEPDLDDDEGAEPDGPETEEEDSLEKLRSTGDRIIRESTPVDYIHWEDFFVFPHNARTWKEVVAIGKRVYMTRDQMKTRFGKTIGKAVPLRKDNRAVGSWEGTESNPDDKGEVFEIWSSATKEVFWVAEGYDYLLDRKDDPLELESFYPTPRPIFANTTNSTIYPVPDYIEYQDQAIQIDELTQRIAMLSKACKVAGVYNAAAKDIQRLLDESVENELIPVDDWAAFAEKGGVAGNISLLPLKEIIGVINELIMVKEKCVVEMDRLTGITDIMRGTTDARETLGGQRLKTNSAGTRLTRRQNEVARFCRDTVKIMADIMAQHFSDKSLIDVSGAMYEEGLGDIDVDTMQDVMSSMPPQMGHNGGPPMPGMLPGMPPGIGSGPLGGPPPQGAMHPGMPPMLPPPAAPMPNGPMAVPGGPAPMPPGPMAVPPGAQMPQGPMSLPGQPMPGMPPMGQPQLLPELQAKLEGMKRIMDAIALIRNEKLRGFRVDIEVDSTIFGDAQQEKGDRTQFITAVTSYLQQAMVMSGQVPEIAPLLGKLLQFGVRGFRVGRDLEAAIEDFCDEAVELAKKKAAAAQNQPNPQMLTAQAQVVKAQAAAEGTKAKVANDAARLQLDAQQHQQETQGDAIQAQAEVARQQEETRGEQANNQADLQSKAMDMKMKEMAMQLEKMKFDFESMRLAREAMKPMNEVNASIQKETEGG